MYEKADIYSRIGEVSVVTQKQDNVWKDAVRRALPSALFLALGAGLGIVGTLAATQGSGQQAVAPSFDFLSAKPTYTVAAAPEAVPSSYLAARPLNNSCLNSDLNIPEGPRTFDACGFVIQSTDEVWNLRGNVEEAIEKYFHEDYLDAGSWGKHLVGKKALREAILMQMRAFPDIQIHITDCVCNGNDDFGYKCAMPDVLTGTNVGPSIYGPATGRYARWSGMVQSLVKKNPETGQWQYYAEWGVHDEWALVQQLGLDFSRVPHPARNLEVLHDCTPLQRFAPWPVLDMTDAADMRRKA